jgi:hypothetical protein
MGQLPKNVPEHCRAEFTRIHFPETQACRDELFLCSFYLYFYFPFYSPFFCDRNLERGSIIAVNIVFTSYFTFLFSELSVSLDSTKLHYDVLFLDRIFKKQLLSLVTILFKTFMLLSINLKNKQMIQRIDVFGLALKMRNEMSILLFLSQILD